MGRAANRTYPSLVADKRTDERFRAVLGSRRGRPSLLTALTPETAAQASARLVSLLDLLDSDRADSKRVTTAGLLERALAQLAGGRDFASEVEAITVIRRDHTGQRGQYKSTVEDLVTNRGLEGLYGALVLCTKDFYDLGDINTGEGYGLQTVDGALVALQIVGLIVNDWDWLTDLGLGDV